MMLQRPAKLIAAQDSSEVASVWTPGVHVPELDGVRGFAILAVTIYRFARDIPTDTTLGRVLNEMVHFGDRGVDLFFVLSGFLITGILLDSRHRPHFFRNFIARRTLRIFPLYFASLAIFVLIIPALWSKHPYQMAVDNQFFLWTYLANMRCAWLDQWAFGSLDHFWSLSVEEHFYLLWPLGVFLLGLRRTAFVAVLLAGICACARIGFAVISDNGIAPDVSSFFRFDGLLLGGAIAAIAHTSRGLHHLRPCAIVLLIVALPACIYLGLRHDRMLTISHTGWALVWTSVLILVTTSRRCSGFARILRSRFLCFLGKYSYAMYVFQSPLIPLVAGLWSVAAISTWLGSSAYSAIAAHGIYVAGMFGLTVATALLSWNLIERHCLKLKKFFPT